MITDINMMKDLADRGDIDAQYEYGQYCYQNSGSDSYALEESFYYFTRSAEQGHPDAQFCVGAAYYHGEGVMQSYLEAVKWFHLAAEQHQINALYNLGICYERGCGVEKNLRTALEYYRSAAYYGHKEAKQAVRDVKRQLWITAPWYVRVWRYVLLWLILFFVFSVFQVVVSLIFS